jgi:hypothetical protein
MIRELTEDEVTFDVEYLPEDDHPRGHFASGDDEWDKQTVAKILSDMEWNPLAWCIAKVTVSWGGYRVSEYLGGCSFESEKDFTSDNSDYYDDMKRRALEGLNAKLRAEHAKLEVLRVKVP